MIPLDGSEGWSALAVPDMDVLPRPVVLRSQRMLPKQIFPLHRHRWHQFVYATSGTLVVTVAGRWYVITPEQAIWVPRGTEHTTGALAGAEFRNLYVAEHAAPALPAQCTVLSVTPLLRELIRELDAIRRRGSDGDDGDAYLGRIDALVLDQLARLPCHDFHLPWPASAGLRRLCEALHAQPADPRGLDDWGRELGASGRTLARRFERELGIGFREWRQRLRIFRAMEWLGAGRRVTDVALELGYASPSAFAYAFRQLTGAAPSAHRGGGRGADDAA